MEISIAVKFVYCMFKRRRNSYNTLKISKEIFKFLATKPQLSVFRNAGTLINIAIYKFSLLISIG